MRCLYKPAEGPPRRMIVKVHDLQGNLLWKGLTDTEGNFSMTLPEVDHQITFEEVQMWPREDE